MNSESSQPPGPISWLIGSTIGFRCVPGHPGLSVSDAQGGEIVFRLTGEPKLDSGRGHWCYREVEGGLQIGGTVERRPDQAAGTYRAVLKNSGSVAREVNAFRVCFDFEAEGTDWAVKTCGGGVMDGVFPTPAFEIRRHHFVGDAKRTIGTGPCGRSSNEYLPLMIVTGQRGAKQSGFWYGMEWSAEWYASASLEGSRNLFRCDLGVPVRRLRLEPGEELAFPTVHAGCFHGDDMAGSNALRRYLWEVVQPDYQGEKPYPKVSYDSWFGLGNEGNEALLRPQVDRAAEIGVETWVLDAGWFGRFAGDVGNWHQPDAGKFPDGLEPFARSVREQGMDFGLWFEPERAERGTWAQREYPELFWSFPDGGDRFHLNLARRDAQDWMIEMMSGWIERLDLRWSRIDYNIKPAPYWHAADPTGKIQFGYVAGLYRVLDTLRERHPQWMIENCATGGRRIDLGTIARSHTHWFSDHTVHPEVCRWMQLRAAEFLPGNCTNSSLAIDQGQGDPEDIDRAMTSRMMGKLSFDGDIASLSEAAADRCRHWVEVYKQFRPLLVGDFRRLTRIPERPDEWDVAEFSSPGGDEAIVAAFGGASVPTDWSKNLPEGPYENLANGKIVTDPQTAGIHRRRR